MICADVRLTEFPNYQAHDAPVPRTLLRYAVRWPLGMHDESKRRPTEGGKMTFLINRLRVEPPHIYPGDVLIKFISVLYADIRAAR